MRRLPGGVFEFDTVAEAVEFERLVTANGTPQAKKPDKADKPIKSVGGRDVDAFLRGLHPNQALIINALAGGELTADELAQKTGLTMTQIGPVLRHLRDRGEKYHLDPDGIVITNRKAVENGKPTSSYRLGNELSVN